jgi:hypothetical protein
MRSTDRRDARGEAPPAPVSATGSAPTTAATAEHLSRRLTIAAATALVLAALIYLVAVHTALGHRFDNAALLGSQSQRWSVRVADMNRLRRITADSVAAVLAVVVLIGLLRRRPRLAITAALAGGLAVVITDLLRVHLLERHALVASDAVVAAMNTYPSGHTAATVGSAMALVLVVGAAWRGLAAVVAGSVGWATAADVQSAGWHRPSDAVGAALIAFAAATLGAAVLTRWRPVGTGRRTTLVPGLVALGIVWVGSAAISALNAARVLRFLVGHPDAVPPTAAIRADAYQLSVNLTVVVVVTLLAVLLVLLGRYELDQPANR